MKETTDRHDETPGITAPLGPSLRSGGFEDDLLDPASHDRRV
jgi:hypothetical protein